MGIPRQVVPRLSKAWEAELAHRSAQHRLLTVRWLDVGEAVIAWQLLTTWQLLAILLASPRCHAPQRIDRERGNLAIVPGRCRRPALDLFLGAPQLTATDPSLQHVDSTTGVP